VFPIAEHHRALQNFKILHQLGSGGAGQVYLARSRGGRLVAIKVLSDAKERDPAFSRALAHEASLCVRLAHPAIVQVRAFLEDEGFAALVFDYVEGLALSKLMKLCGAHGVRLPDRVTWHIVERVLTALAFAHAITDEAREPAPIVHRDVSPSNVLLAWSGDVRLTDFGIAKMLGVSPATKFGLVKGTLGCMAPEQARGEPVDQRADVYATGLLAWRLSTGRNPFAAQQSEEMELLRAMRNPRIKPLSALRPNLPEALLDAVGTALSVDPQYRTIRAEAFARVVRESIDVDTGHAELAVLLSRWRTALERTKLRADGTRSSTTSGDHPNNTMRYEDLPPAYDDVPADGPTVQMQALPGDEQLWAALAEEGGLNLPRATVSDSDHVRVSDAEAGPPPVASAALAPPTVPMVPLTSSLAPVVPPPATPRVAAPGVLEPWPVSTPAQAAAQTVPPAAMSDASLADEQLMALGRVRARNRTIATLVGVLVAGLLIMYLIAGRS
jgi:serine/threonine protein kinase